MVARQKEKLVTPQEYLERERKAELKSEYYDGVIVAMAGASRRHDRIAGDTFTEINLQLRGRSAGASRRHDRITSSLLRHLGNQLDGSPCEPFTSDMRVAVPARNRYFYPDVSVVCGEARFQDEHVDTLLNPILLIEVLSPSTAETDRDEKFTCYQTIESLSVYVLVSQDRPLVEVHTRAAHDGLWQYRRFSGLGASVLLPVIGCALKLADIYARVSFLSDTV